MAMDRRRLHFVDALALLLALAAATIAWAFLFRRREPPPRPVEPILGAVLDVEFAADLPWKQTFPAAGARVVLDEALDAEVLSAGPAPSGRAGFRGARLRVACRDEQKPDSLNEFRWGVWRGSRLWMRSREDAGPPISAVEAEVVAVEPAAAR